MFAGEVWYCSGIGPTGLITATIDAAENDMLHLRIRRRGGIDKRDGLCLFVSWDGDKEDG